MSPAARETAARTVYRLPVPPANPPYDDELTTDVVGSLALAAVPGLPSAGRPQATALRLVPAVAEPDADEFFTPQRTARADLPDPTAWTRGFAQAVVEVLAGHRVAAQLVGSTTMSVYAGIEAVVTRSAHRPTAARRNVVRPVVRSVHVSEPTDGIAEACAVVDTGSRRRAVAMRLEGVDGRWTCTALQCG